MVVLNVIWGLTADKIGVRGPVMLVGMFFW